MAGGERTNSAGSRQASDNALSVNTPVHVVVTYDGSDDVGGNSGFHVYIDGVNDDEEDNDWSFGTDIDPGTTTIGESGWGSEDFEGTMDEVRFSNTLRSSSWIQTSYNNQNSPATFLSVQAEETGPGPVGYWSFDEGYGTTAHDESGQGNSGTITGATWQEESQCVSGKCLYFDGTNDYINAGTAANLDIAGEVSLCTWFKAIAIDAVNFDVLVGRADASGIGNYYLAVTESSKLEFGWSANGSVIEAYNTDAGALELNKWYHACGVRISDSEVELYINGVEYSVNTGNDVSVPTGNLTMQIGGLGLLDDYYFNGYIDEVKVYPYTRSAEEIRQDYNAGLAGVQSNSGVSASFGGTSDKWMSDGLVGYWKFDEAAGTYDDDNGYEDAIDSSGLSYTGDATGNASTTAGKFGNAATFDGSGDYLLAGDIDEMDGARQLTITGWFYREDSADDLAVEKGSGTTNKVNINLDGTTLYLNASNGSNSYARLQNVTTVGWQYITLVFDGTGIGNTGRLKGYIDGEEITNFTYHNDDIADRLASNAGELYIGRTNIFSIDSKGKIDELRIYNRALTTEEVKQLYEWAPGPTAYWKFDEGAGNTTYDSVASSTLSGASHATLYNSPIWVKGKYGTALDFSASTTDDDRAYFTGNRYWDNVPDVFTIMAWVKVRSAGGGSMGRIIDAGDSIGPFMMSMDGGNDFGIQVFDNSSYSRYRTIGNDVEYDKWQHLTAVFNNGSTTLYVNGIEKTTSEVTTDVSGNLRNTVSYIAFGNRPSGTMDRDFDGVIDEVKYYTYARTPRQILEDIAGGQAQKQPVLHLSFDEGRGNTAHDSSGFNNNGSLQPGTGGSNTSSSSMWTKSGRFGGAMEFDGTDDYVEADPTDWQGAFSTSVWVKAKATGQNLYTGIFSSDTGATDANYQIDLDGTSPGNYRINYGDDTLESIPFGTVDTNWHMLTVTYDEDTFKTYYDGKFASSVSSWSGGGDHDEYRVGANRGKTQFFDGIIDEVKVWNYALTKDEINIEYNSGVATMLSSPDFSTATTGAAAKYCVPGSSDYCMPPIYELKMDEKSGSTIYDTSGNGNDTTMYSAASWARGKYGSGVRVDGATGETMLSGSGLSFGGNSGTLSYWFKDEGSPDTTDFSITYATNDYQELGLFYYYGANRFIFYLGGSSASLYLDQDIWDYNWHHVEVTWGPDNYARTYIDGTFVDDASITVTEPTVTGWRIGGTSDDTKGIFDEFRIYNYARSASQIAWDYNQGGTDRPLGF